MSDRVTRAFRTFVVALPGALLAAFLAKAAGLQGVSDVSTIVTVLGSVVLAAVNGAGSAALHVLFPPSSPPSE